MGACLSAPQADADGTAGAAAKATKGAEGQATTSGVGKGKHAASDVSLILGKPTADVKSLYEIRRILGQGQFGTTRLVVDKKSGEKLACKSISKRKLQTPEDIADVQREVQIMHHLEGHPNVVALRGAYEDKHHVHLVMELCSGGELFDRIVERGHYTERDAADLLRTIVKVVGHCHDMNVIHRDLKPENFLLVDKDADAALKATDFGLSVFFKDGQEFSDIVGSAYYVAPEVLRRKYTKEADIWSCGVILYILLCGMPPFYGDNEQQIFESVIRAPLDFNSDPWPKVSEPAKDIVRRMLVRDPRKRATAAEVLAHEWVREGGVAGDNVIEPEVLTRMRGFAAMNKLKKAALKIIALNLPQAEIEGLKSMFAAMDKDGSGTITVDEMREGLKSKGTLIPEEDLAALMENADLTGDGTIDYEEFLAATMNLGKLQKDEHLHKAFQHFDADGSGYITVEELEAALAQQDGDVAALAEQIKNILAEVDKDKDGRIDYEEFCVMMRGDGGAAAAADAAAAPAHARRGGFLTTPPVVESVDIVDN
ncbi:MAG: kinase-like domain-containing protein [Monoraphidium minutum]|nr:MAG: kinase-like domain-containing protein [Monoraphidium minutum]